MLDGLTKGKHAITVEATDLDNESDKLLLYQVSRGDGTPVDQVTYPGLRHALGFRRGTGL